MAVSFHAAAEGRRPQKPASRLLLTCLLAATVVLVSACGARSLTRAPVEDRGTGMTRPMPGAEDSGNAKLLPGAENAGKAGYYTVRPGDTLIRIGLDTGQNWRDIGRWSNLENPNLIEVGQVLRVVPPVDNSQAVAKPITSGTVTASQLPSGQPATPATAPTPAAAASAAAAAKPATPPAAIPASSAGEDDVAWIWPVQGAGTVLANFDDAKNKGMDIAGKAGDAIIASADGRVVYAGAGLRGYGNLIILKHNNTFLTAYAHNQTLLVKEDQSVRKGQKIAEMGSTDADRVKLHFEIRRQGKPVDPAKYLPAK